MKCLAVNTATKVLSVALVDGDRVLHVFETAEARDQGNILLERIRQGLKENNLSFADLDLLAIVTGPGSFTGIRVGLATMRALALATNKPLIGVSSFDMFSVTGMEAINIVAIESWRAELYFAVLDEEGHALIECMNETPDTFFQRFRLSLPGHHPIVISGDAGEAVVPLFPLAGLSGKEANAVDVARLALQKFKKGGVFPRPVPYYLREADITISTRMARTLEK